MKKISQIRKFIQTVLAMVIVFASCYIWATDILASDPLLDTLWANTNVYDDFQGSPVKWLAMPFTIGGVSANVTSVAISGYRVGTAEAGDVVNAHIYTISGGDPDTLVATSNDIAANSIGTSEEEIEATFTGGLLLPAGTYAMVWTATEIGGAYAIGWEKYSAGNTAWYSFNSGSTWTNTTTKNYKVYGIATVLEATILTGGINMINNSSGQVAVSIISLGTADNYTQRGVEYGTVSGNLSESITASGTWTAVEPFDTILTGLTPSTLWYHRGKILTNDGWVYGNERSFTYTNIVPYVTVDTGDAVLSQSGTGVNFLVSFWVEHTPDFIDSDNVTVYLSEDYPPTSNMTAMYDYSYYYFLRASDMSPAKRMSYSSSNVTTGDINYSLSANTTYFYMAEIIFDSISYNTTIKSFTTPTAYVPDKPAIVISKLLDIGNLYGRDYGFIYEVQGKITTNDTTEVIYRQGIEVSKASDLGLLTGKTYTFTAPTLGIDNTFTLIINLTEVDTAFEESTLYFQAFIKTPYYGSINSIIVEITPDTNIEETETGVIISIQDQVAQVKTQLGLVGAMGTWAFLGMLVLLVALLFGIALVATKDETLKRMIGIVWMIATIAILGAFIFTGQLGIWPIIILVGGVVILLIVFASVKLSGQGGTM